MPSLTAPIVGLHFHPPAKWLLEKLPQQTPLILSPNPDNPHDPNAIEILIDHDELGIWIDNNTENFDEWDQELIGMGWSCQQLQELTEPLLLGFIPANQKTSLGNPTNIQFLLVLSGTDNWTAHLTYLLTGQSAVKLNYSIY